MKKTKLSYGDSYLSLKVPETVDILSSPDLSECLNPVECIRQAIQDPIGTLPLSELLKLKKPRNAVITISDITRPVPNKLFLPLLIEVLQAEGVAKEKITILIGTGMHRNSTPEEMIRLVGDEIFRSCKVVDHSAIDPDGFITVGRNPPVRLNKVFASADFKIVTGFIEPHFMAGFSGGRKGVCPALADLNTIEEFHGYHTLSSENAREGVLDNNPCHELALSAAEKAGVDFLLNVTINKAYQLTNVFCGDLKEAHKRGCEYLSSHVTTRINKSYDLVITSAGGAPLDLNYYQSVKGMCMALPAMKPGGTLVQVSSCREGVGGSDFVDLLKKYQSDVARFLGDISDPGWSFRLDQWEVQMLCRVLYKTGRNKFWFFSNGIKDEDRDCIWSYLESDENWLEERLQTFIDSYINRFPGNRIAVIPEGPYTIVCLE